MNELELKIAIAEQKALAHHNAAKAAAQVEGPAIGANYQGYAEAEGSPNFWADTGREGVRVASQGLRGAGASVGTMLEYNPFNAADAIAKRLMGQPTLDLAQRIPEGLERLGAVVEPQSETGQILGRGAEWAGAGAVMPGAGKLSAILSGLGGATSKALENDGMSPGYASAVGVGTTVVPALLGGGWQGLKTGYQALKAPSARRAAQVNLQKMTGLGVDDIATALKTMPDDELSKFMTTAEILPQDKAIPMALLEHTLPKANPKAGAVYAGHVARRQGARDKMLDALETGPQQKNEAAGNIIKGTLGSKAQQTKDKASQLFESIDPEGTSNIAIGEARQATNAAVDKFYGPGAGKLKGEAAEVVKELGEAGYSKDWRFLNGMRSRAGEVAETATKNGRNREAAVMRSVVRSIDKAANTAADMAEGFTPAQAALWKQANKEWSTYQKLYNSGAVKEITKEGTKASQVVKKALDGKPESMRQVIDASSRAPDVMQALRRKAIDSIPRDSTDKLTPNKMKRWLASNEDNLAELFEARHMKALKRVSQDLRSEAKVLERAKIPSGGGSSTAQNFSFIDALKQAKSGQVAFRHPFKTNIAKQFLRYFEKNQNDAVDMLLTQATLDPKFAVALLSSTEKSTATIMGSLAKAGFEGVKGGAKHAAKRIGTTTYAAETSYRSRN